MRSLLQIWQKKWKNSNSSWKNDPGYGLPHVDDSGAVAYGALRNPHFLSITLQPFIAVAVYGLLYIPKLISI